MESFWRGESDDAEVGPVSAGPTLHGGASSHSGMRVARSDATGAASAPRPGAAHDDDRLGEHLIQNWGLLVGMSRRLAGAAIDPDDLLSDALLATYSQWRRAPGTIQHLNAYIIGAMRNRVKDELKSPRSRVGSLEDEDALRAPHNPAIDRIELESEMSLLREALAQLPDDQRSVLEALFYRGRSAGQLTTELQRSRPAVSMLARRAKNNLKRMMLKILLEKEAPREACRHAAGKLPLVVGDLPPTDGEAGAHWAGCARCRRVWHQFGMAGAASIGAFLVVGDTLAGGTRLAAAAALVPSPVASGDESARIGSRGWRRAGLSLALAGIAAVAVTTWILPQQFSAEQSRFDVVRTPLPGGEVGYSVRFESAARGWRVDSLRIDGAAPAKSIETPEGWECALEDGDVRCVTDARSALSAVFLVRYAGDSAPGYALELRVTTPSGSEITGTATDGEETANG